MNYNISISEVYFYKLITFSIIFMSSILLIPKHFLPKSFIDAPTVMHLFIINNNKSIMKFICFSNF